MAHLLERHRVAGHERLALEHCGVRALAKALELHVRLLAPEAALQVRLAVLAARGRGAAPPASEALGDRHRAAQLPANAAAARQRRRHGVFANHRVGARRQLQRALPLRLHLRAQHPPYVSALALYGYNAAQAAALCADATPSASAPAPARASKGRAHTLTQHQN